MRNLLLADHAIVDRLVRLVPVEPDISAIITLILMNIVH